MEILLELRRERGLTLEEIAERIGVSRASLSTWERGLCSPTYKNAKLLADFFGITIEQLEASAEADGHKIIGKPTDARDQETQPGETVITRPEFVRCAKLSMEKVSEIIGDSRSTMLALYAFRADLERRLF